MRQRHVIIIAVFCLLPAVLIALPAAAEPAALTGDAWITPGDITLRHQPRTYSDPPGDYSWSAGYSGVSDVESAFNAARQNEGGGLPALAIPSQSIWDGMSSAQKALWLINKERDDRGIDPFYGLETNVTSVAQNYAAYLLSHNKFGHSEDGSTPELRMKAKSAINDCNDGLFGENIAVLMTSGSSNPLAVERAVYMWMYDDWSCCAWGHRHNILLEGYNDNNGDGWEGFLGIGHATGGPYTFPGDPPPPWTTADMIVMDFFDPCASWDYTGMTPWTPSGGGGGGGGGGGSGTAYIDLTPNKYAFGTTDYISVTANVSPLSTPFIPYVRVIFPSGRTLYYVKDAGFTAAAVPYLPGPYTLGSAISGYPVLQANFSITETGNYTLQGYPTDTGGTLLGAMDSETLTVQ